MLRAVDQIVVERDEQRAIAPGASAFVGVADDHRARAVRLLAQARRQSDPTTKAACLGMARTFDILARRAKIKADLERAFVTDSPPSRSVLNQAPPVASGADNPHLGGSEGKGPIADAPASNGRDRPAPLRQCILAGPDLFHLTVTQCEIVLEAYVRSNAAGQSVADCYTAGVNALHRLYADVPHHLVAAQAVKILATDARLVDVTRSWV
jgi:hypothetical protein